MEITLNYKTGKKFLTKIGQHEIAVDLSVEHGGDDSAPNPSDYFLVSLTSCIGFYVLGYCENVGLDPTGMRIVIRADKETNPSRLDNIGLDIHLPAAEVGKRREAVLNVARKCVIHNTIKHSAGITIDLKTG